MSAELDFTQLRAFTAFEKGLSVALLGGAGSGKSFVLKRMLDDSRKRYGSDGVLACAWTNQAALNLCGRTIHACFGVPSGFHFDQEDLWRKVKENESLCISLRKIEAVFIDEISILKENILDSIDFIMRCTAPSSGKACLPMGGRQTILAGDPFQLEPIGVDYTKDGEKHVFSARAWILPFGGFGSGVIALLRGNHRQTKDKAFYDILTRIRDGSSTEEDISTINNSGKSTETPPRSHTVLCLLKAEVDAVNKAELAMIPGYEWKSHALDIFQEKCTFDTHKRLSQTAPKTVTVKPGCDILLTRKIGSSCPGSRGRVLAVWKHSKNGGRSDLLELEIKLDEGGRALRIVPMQFQVLSVDSSVVACRTQLPIVSAYALTVYRAQGLTLPRVAMDFTKVGSWIPTGMTYVALSRCTSMDGLWVKGLEKRHIVVNSHAHDIMKEIRKMKKYLDHRVIASRVSFMSDRELKTHEPETYRRKRGQDTFSHDMSPSEKRSRTQ